MMCSADVLKDYVFGELDTAGRRAVESHMGECGECRQEWERLQMTQTALFSVRDEEMPRRIAFVSDKVFEPTWWQRFWNSAPKLGFASAAMLSAALVVFALYRPAPVVQQAGTVDAAQIDRQMQAAVTKAVASVEERHQAQMMQVVAELEKKRVADREEYGQILESNFSLWKQKMNVMRMAMYERGGE
jgi:anti-sigma factor RsiW